MELSLIIAAGLLLACANGTNDNFKGVATLHGGGALSYRRALLWGTLTTLTGSLTALFAMRGLLDAFSGKGLVPEAIVADPRFPMAVGLAAGGAALLATRMGFRSPRHTPWSAACLAPAASRRRCPTGSRP